MNNDGVELRRLLERLQALTGTSTPEAREGMNAWLRREARRGETPAEPAESVNSWIRRLARGG